MFRLMVMLQVLSLQDALLLAVWSKAHSFARLQMRSSSRRGLCSRAGSTCPQGTCLRWTSVRWIPLWGTCPWGTCPGHSRYARLFPACSARGTMALAAAWDGGSAAWSPCTPCTSALNPCASQSPCTALCYRSSSCSGSGNSCRSPDNAHLEACLIAQGC